jgi:hypothetical protein
MAMADNRFYFNTPTKPQDFVGRSVLLEEMVNGLKSGRPDSYGIVGGRRFGKSSLIGMLAHRLSEDLKQGVISEMRVIPVIISLKGITPTSPSDVFGFACHRMRKATWGNKKPLPILPSPIIDLGLPAYTQVEPSPTSVQGVEAAVEEIITAAYYNIGEVRIVLMLDEIEHALGYPWTADLFANLRYLVYDSDYKPYLRLIMAGTGRYLGLNEKGSPLFNAITGRFLEAFDPDGVAMLLERAPGIAPEVAQAVAQQGGGHPFILQHLLYYLAEKGTALCTLDDVAGEVKRFRLARLIDLDAWWDDVQEDGRSIYYVLCQAGGWMTVEEIAQAVSPDLQKERGLRELTCHGFIIHDALYQRYRVHGQLFRDWFMERYKSPTSLKGLVTMNENAAVTTPTSTGARATSSSPPPLVFISYKHSDYSTKVARKLRNALEVVSDALGFRIFLDDEDLHASDDWQESIDNAMAHMTHFIALLTNDYLLKKSTECRRELLEALNRFEDGKKTQLLLVLVDDIQPNLISLSEDRKAGRLKSDHPQVENLGQINFLGPYNPAKQLVPLEWDNEAKLQAQIKQLIDQFQSTLPKREG